MFNINGNLILSKITKLGYSQREFSDIIGTSQPTLSRMISGKSTTIDLKLLYKISQKLNLKLEELITDNGEKMQYQSEYDILNEMEMVTEQLYKSIKILKETRNNRVHAYRNQDSDLLILNENDDEIYSLDIKTNKSKVKGYEHLLVVQKALEHYSTEKDDKEYSIKDHINYRKIAEAISNNIKYNINELDENFSKKILGRCERVIEDTNKYVDNK